MNVWTSVFTRVMTIGDKEASDKITTYIDAMFNRLSGRSRGIPVEMIINKRHYIYFHTIEDKWAIVDVTMLSKKRTYECLDYMARTHKNIQVQQ